MAGVGPGRTGRFYPVMYATRTRGLATILLLALLVRENVAWTVHLTDQCGKTINIKSHGGQINSQPGATYTPSTDCTVTLQADPGKHIYLRLEELDIPDRNGQTCDDGLQIYDSASASGPTLDDTICGSAEGGEYQSSGDAVTLRFGSDADSRRGSGFLIVYAAYDNGGSCTSSQFECGTGRCISAELKCDLADHCGDNTDESGSPLYANCANSVTNDNGVSAASGGLSTGVIAAIAIATILGTALLVIVICFVIMHQQASSATQRADSEKQEPALQTVAYTNQPPAAQPAPAQDNMFVAEIDNPTYQPAPAQQPTYQPKPAHQPSYQPAPAHQPKPGEGDLYSDHLATEEAAKPVYADTVPGPPVYIPPVASAPVEAHPEPSAPVETPAEPTAPVAPPEPTAPVAPRSLSPDTITPTKSPPRPLTPVDGN